MVVSNIFLFLPRLHAEMIQFDGCIFFNWVVQPPPSNFLENFKQTTILGNIPSLPVIPPEVNGAVYGFSTTSLNDKGGTTGFTQKMSCACSPK